MRAFDAGWGGAVWKTIGDPIVNVSSRYSSVDWNGQRMMGLNNIELISDRPIEVNLREITEVKKRYPQHAVIASLMVESKREAWHDIVKRAEDAGADGLELNFGCPHGMSERGMGCAVGQVPEYSCMITEWVKEVARTPVLVKLTPNITDIRAVARAAKRGGADGLSAINTINSITGIDLDTLHAAAQCGRPFRARRLLRAGGETHRPAPGAADRLRPGSGAADLRHRRHLRMARGGGVLPAGLRHGAGLHRRHALRLSHRGGHDRRPEPTGWTKRACARIDDFRGRACRKLTEWKHLDLNYKIVARIHPRDSASAATSATSPAGMARTSASICDGHAMPAAVEAASRARIAVTPIAKLDRGAESARHNAAASASRTSMRRSAWAATSAGWYARFKAASPWSRWKPASRSKVWEMRSAIMNTLIRNGTVVTAQRPAPPMS